MVPTKRLFIIFFININFEYVSRREREEGITNILFIFGDSFTIELILLLYWGIGCKLYFEKKKTFSFVYV